MVEAAAEDTKVTKAVSKDTKAALTTTATANESAKDPGLHQFMKKARIVAEWEKRIPDKLDKPGSGWATTREWHDTDTIN